MHLYIHMLDTPKSLSKYSNIIHIFKARALPNNSINLTHLNSTRLTAVLSFKRMVEINIVCICFE